MMTRRLGIAMAGGALALIGGAYAWTQVQPPAPARPVATEIALQRSRADEAALAQARQAISPQRFQSALKEGSGGRAVYDAIQTSDVPVLGPADIAKLNAARFYDGDRYYALVIEEPGRIVEIYGATKAFQPAAGATPGAAAAVPPPAATQRQIAILSQPLARARAAGLANVMAERTEYGVDVAFSRFGAAYNLTFLCDNPNAPDCSAAEAIAYAAGLQVLGGGQ